MTELIIGRESGAERPRLAIQHEGKTIYSTKNGIVPKNVSRKHCRILIGEDFNISIEDLTENNFMFVNGAECKRRGHIQIDDKIELGPDRFPVNLEEIIKHITAEQSYHIGHLEAIYDDYQRLKKERQEKQGKFNAISGIPGVISMASIALAAIPDLGIPRAPMLVVAVFFAIAFAVIRWGMATSSPEKAQQLENDFRDKYRCPNPTCNHFLGQTPYKDLLRHKSCPYCKAKFIP